MKEKKVPKEFTHKMTHSDWEEFKKVKQEFCKMATQLNAFKADFEEFDLNAR